MSPTFRMLARGDVEEAGAVLGRAFGDSPAYAAILAHLDGGRRAAAIVRVKTAFAAAAVRHQTAEGAWWDGRLAAVALAAAPGQWPPSLAAKLRQALACASTGPRGAANFLRADLHMARRHVRERHHYLFVLGVDTAMQGRGLGSALLRRLGERADAEGLPCYLETDLERNLRLYRGAGYRVLTDETVATRPGYRMWTMRRPPRSTD